MNDRKQIKRWEIELLNRQQQEFVSKEVKMEGNVEKQLLNTIKTELFCYPKYTKKDNLKYLIKRIVKPSTTPPRDPYFWPHAMMAQALEAAEELEVLKKYYDGWKKSGMRLLHPDHVMNGYSLVYVYEKTGNVKYKKMMDEIYDYTMKYYESHHQTFPYRKHHPTYIFVDTLGMVVPFLCRYGKLFGKDDATKLGQKLLLEFLENGMDEDTGLPYHGYDLNTEDKYGIIGWGRAVGWLLLAMADSVEYMEEGREKETIVKAFQNLSKQSFEYFRETGYFSWQLPAKEGPVDTSATAMIGYAIKKGKNKAYLRCDCELDEMMERTILEERLSIKQAMERTEDALKKSFREGKIWDCSGECEGFAQYPQVYGSYPWSNAPALRFLLEKE